MRQRRIGNFLIAVFCGAIGLSVISTVDTDVHASDPTGKPDPAPRLISESEIPPATAVFEIDRGRSFSYVLSIDSSFGGGKPDSRTMILAQGLGGFPYLQRVSCIGRASQDDTTAVILVNQVKFKDPRAMIAAGKIPLFQRWLCTASIDTRTGSIREESRTRLNQWEQADTLREGHWDFPSTLWQFYGRWMLHLSDDFTYEKAEAVPVIGEVKTSLETVARDTISGRECFTIRFQRRPARGSGIEITYWVDIAERIAVQVQDAGLILKLSVPVADSAGSGAP